MKALVFLALSNSILVKCWTPPPPPLLLPSTPETANQYLFPSSEIDDSKKYGLANDWLPEVSANYGRSNQLPENPFTNSHQLNVHDNYIKSLNEENEGHKRLKSFYKSLAEKLKSKLLYKVSKLNNEQSPLNERENVPANKQDDFDFLNGRKKFTEANHLAVHYGVQRPSELYNLELLNHFTNNDDLELGFLDSGDLSRDNDDFVNGYYMESMNQDLPVLRYAPNVFTHTFETVPKTAKKLQTSVTVLNNRGSPDSQIGLIPGKYFYKQPIFSYENPIKSFYSTIKYPINRFLEFKNNLFNYGKHHHIKHNQKEVENIKSYITQVMSAHKYANPLILQVINDANELDLTKLENLDQSQLIQLGQSDLQSLKKYFILILNRYGITPYTYKLLEFINLVERKPKHGSYLLYKILNNQKTVQSLTDREINQIKQHLEQILKEYGTSPYILPFVRYIGGIHLLPNTNENFYIYSFDTFDTSNYVSEGNMRKAYVYLLQAYKSNPYIIRVLQNLNEIYEKSNVNIALPILDLNDFQNLSYLNYNDLNLFVKYILQIIKQRGVNTYIDQLLIYLKQLQTKFDKGKHAEDINHETNHDFEKRLDLTNIYEYLLHLNRTGVPNSQIIDILKRLNIRNGMDISVITLNNTDLNENDLVQIREFLEQFNREDKQNENSFSPITLNDTIDIRFDDLHQIYQYLLNQHNFINSPYLIVILNLLRQAQNQPYTKGFVRVRYHDFEQIYNYLTLTQEDTTNPIFIMIQHYVNQRNKNKNSENKVIINEDLYENNEIISDKQINLYEIYNFLIHKSKSEQVDPRLLEILQYLNTTFVLPNGELKIRIVNPNNKGTFDGINPNDLHKLLLHIQNLRENKVFLNELLQYVKQKLNSEYDEKILLLSGASRDSLRRIKNFLLTFSKEHNESPYVIQILLVINRILGVPDNDYNYALVLDDTDSKMNENDIDVLIKYISTVKVTSLNNDELKFFENIREYRELIKKDKEKQDKYASYKVFFLEIMNNNQISPAVKDVIKLIYMDFGVDHSNDQVDYTIRLSSLSNKDLDVLVTYLREFVQVFGPNPHVQKILVCIDKIRDNSNNGDGKVIIFNNTDFLDDEKGKQTIKITKENLNIINKYLLDLINQYGDDSNIMHVIYAINNIEGTPDQAIDLTKLITNNHIGFIKLNDINILKKYLLKLIQKHGPNSHLMHVLRHFSKLHRGQVEDANRPFVQVNGTHVLAVLEKDDINRIKSYLMDIINNYGSNPYLINILKVINALDKDPNENHTENVLNNPHPNVYTFTRLSRNDLNKLTQYILQLIEKLGARNALLDLLDFIHRIYGDAVVEVNENEKKQFILEISKEIENLKEHGVKETMQNMDKGILTSLYLQLLNSIFASMSSTVNIELPTILGKLLDIYKVEVNSVNKYIILKLYEYLLKNKGTGYENFWNTGFIDVILDINNDGNDNYPKKIIIPSDKKHVIIEPYDYNKDIEKALKIIVDSTINKAWKVVQPDESIKKELFDYTIPDNSGKETNFNKVSCITADKKLEDIWRVLNGVVTLKQLDSEFTIDDLNRMIDMFLIFKKKLSRNMNADNIPTKFVVDELEKILLSHQPGKCEQQVDTTTIMTPVVDSLRDGILYLKLKHFADDDIKRIIETTVVEDILPQLKFVSVRECIIRTKKELLNGIYNNIYKNDNDIEMLGNTMKEKVSPDPQTTLAAT